MRNARRIVRNLVILATFLAAPTSPAEGWKIVEGRLVDILCYSRGRHVERDHGKLRDCGRACALDGIPVGVVDGSGALRVLAVNPVGWAEYVGHEVRLHYELPPHADALLPRRLEVRDEGDWVEKPLPKATFHGVPIRAGG